MLAAESKLTTIKVWFSEALIDLYIKNDEFILVNNMLKEYNEMKEGTKISGTSVEILYKYG